jgi:putative phosphoribosyl transferase
MGEIEFQAPGTRFMWEAEMKRFANRTEAGQVLAQELERYRDRDEVIVLALPRGGVPVAFVIAQHLHVPLDIFLVRKLGFPGHEEFAIGAIASGGVRVLNPAAFQVGRVSEKEIDAIAAREGMELERREREYRGDNSHPKLEGKTIILVDDGLATGSTMRAAVEALRQKNPARIIVAVPVASVDAYELIGGEADEIVCASTPEPFHAVGLWYEDFSQTSDEEVKELLQRAEHDLHAPSH